MSLPSTVFIDTNILEQYGYNFASPAIETFLVIAHIRSLTLLLPDATEREVKRHIKEKSGQAQSALRKARHEAPFLQKWGHWPAPERVRAAKDEIAAAYIADWDQFLKNFKVERLGYAGIDMSQVMDWYDEQRPPFGDGNKRKEFPDAFAVASAVAHAKTKGTKVAAVSADPDIRKACGCHPELLYFSDLPTLTEAFIAETKTQIESIKAAVAAHPEEVVARIRESFPELGFYPEEDPEGDVSDVEVVSAALTSVRVIALEDQHCTIAFDADVEFSAYVSYDDPDTMVIDSSEDFRMPLFTRGGTITETTTISATVTLEFDSQWTSILSALDLEIENQDITVQSRPPICHADDDPPEDVDESPDLPPLPEGPEAPPQPKA